MGKSLLLGGSGQVPSTIDTPDTAISVQGSLLSVGSSVHPSRRGTGFVSFTSAFSDNADQEIAVEITDTSIVDSGQFNPPEFTGESPGNRAALQVLGLGSGLAAGGYHFEVTNPSHPSKASSLRLLDQVVLEANLGYTDRDLSGSGGNLLVVEVYERVSEIEDNNPQDLPSDMLAGAGVYYLESGVSSDDFINYADTSFDHSPVAEDNPPIVSSALLYSGGAYRQPPLFHWGTPSSGGSLHTYPIRGDAFQVVRIFEGNKYRYKLVSSSSQGVAKGLVSYRITGGFVVRVALRNVDPLLPNEVDLYYTHFMDSTGVVSPIVTFGQLVYAIKRHNDEQVYVNEQFSGTGFVVPPSNTRYCCSLVSLRYDQGLELPNSASLQAWQNTVLSPVSSGSIQSFQSTSDAVSTLSLTGLPLFNETVRIQLEVSNTVVARVYAPRTAENILGLPPTSPIASLSLGQTLSSVLEGVGFEVVFADVQSEGSTPSPSSVTRAVIQIQGLQNDTSDSPRNFHPYLESVGFLPGSAVAMRSYNLTWTRYSPPLCSSLLTQGSFDNVVYPVLGGSGSTQPLDESLFYQLSGGGTYRPSLSYATKEVTPSNVFNGNTYSFKSFPDAEYLKSPHGRSGEFLPHLTYDPGMGAAAASLLITQLGQARDALAANALDYEVVEGPDSNYWLLLGARPFESLIEGDFSNSNVIDEVFGAGVCAGFFTPLTGSPGGTQLPGDRILSWPVASAYRSPYLGLSNPIPRGIIGNNPQVSLFPKLAGDTVNGDVVSHYGERMPDMDPLEASSSDTQHNFSNHLLGLFSLVYEYVSVYLGEFDDGDSPAGFPILSVKQEGHALLKTLLDYMQSPEEAATVLLTPYLGAEANFADLMGMYRHMAPQPRVSGDERGEYLATAQPTFKLPLLGGELSEMPGLAESSIFLGALPYSPLFKGKIKQLINLKLGVGVNIPDDKVIVVPKPDVRFWSLHKPVAGLLEHTYINPYSEWGYRDNNPIQDILMVDVALLLAKGKWNLDLSWLTRPDLSLAPNLHQSGLGDLVAPRLGYTTLPRDHWRVTRVNGVYNEDSSPLYEEHSAVYNGILWVNGVLDTSFKLDFDCEGEISELTYGDEILVQPTGASNTETGPDLTGFQGDVVFSTRTGYPYTLLDGVDDGGPATITLQPPGAQATQPLPFQNLGGSLTAFGLGDTGGVLAFTLEPVTALSRGDSFRFHLQGGKFSATLNGGSSISDLDITEAPQNLFGRVDLKFLFEGSSSFVVGDRWVIQLSNEHSATNLLSWGSRRWATTGSTASLVLSFPAPTPVDILTISGHNLQEGDTVLVEASEDSGFGVLGLSHTIYVPPPFMSDRYSLFSLLPASTHTYFRVTLTSQSPVVSLRRLMLYDSDTSDVVTFEFPPDTDFPIDTNFASYNGETTREQLAYTLSWSELTPYSDFVAIMALLRYSKARHNEPVIFIEDSDVGGSAIAGTLINDVHSYSKRSTVATLTQGGRGAMMSGLTLRLQEES